MNRVRLTIDETTSLSVSVDFLSETGAATFPEVASYRLDDEESGENIVAEAPITPGESVTIEIPRSANELLNRANRTETRVLTVNWTYGAGQKGGKSEYVYTVRRLEFGA